MYVIFEGIDGVGKSTQIARLVAAFPQAIVTKEPGGTKLGEVVRSLVLGEDFKWRRGSVNLREVCGDMEVADYYGMVEQTGCIYLECEEGHLHASTYSDVIVRRPLDFSLASVGERGILEVVSLLPESYPGHALLTEDERS